MSATTKISLREGSVIAKMYNELKDGKVHNFQTFIAKYKKAGVKKPRVTLFRLCRVMRQANGGKGTGYQIDSSKRTNSIQMVQTAKAEAARAAIKKALAGKAVSKPVTKKVTKSVPATTKAAAVKQVAVAVGASDDDLIEE